MEEEASAVLPFLEQWRCDTLSAGNHRHKVARLVNFMEGRKKRENSTEENGRISCNEGAKKTESGSLSR